MIELQTHYYTKCLPNESFFKKYRNKWIRLFKKDGQIKFKIGKTPEQTLVSKGEYDGKACFIMHVGHEDEECEADEEEEREV